VLTSSKRVDEWKPLPAAREARRPRAACRGHRPGRPWRLRRTRCWRLASASCARRTPSISVTQTHQRRLIRVLGIICNRNHCQSLASALCAGTTPSGRDHGCPWIELVICQFAAQGGRAPGRFQMGVGAGPPVKRMSQTHQRLPIPIVNMSVVARGTIRNLAQTFSQTQLEGRISCV
jgi:hypothetical protein